MQLSLLCQINLPNRLFHFCYKLFLRGFYVILRLRNYIIINRVWL